MGALAETGKRVSKNREPVLTEQGMRDGLTGLGATMGKMKVHIGWTGKTAEAQPDKIREVLREATRQPDDPFVIVDRAAQLYLQTLHGPRGFIVERRKGSERRHFRAVNQVTAQAAQDRPEVGVLEEINEQHRYFQVDEVIAIFIAYARRRPMPSFTAWERIDL